jgi:hypothetical protein
MAVRFNTTRLFRVSIMVFLIACVQTNVTANRIP